MTISPLNQSRSKDASGRGAAVIAYGLMLGGIMTGVTALAGAAVAALWLPRSANWVRGHLRFQIATVAWSIAGLLLGALIWWGFGLSGMAPRWAWTFGYLVFTAQLTWLVGRCAYGLHRLTANRPVTDGS